MKQETLAKAKALEKDIDQVKDEPARGQVPDIQ